MLRYINWTYKVKETVLKYYFIADNTHWKYKTLFHIHSHHLIRHSFLKLIIVGWERLFNFNVYNWMAALQWAYHLNRICFLILFHFIYINYQMVLVFFIITLMLCSRTHVHTYAHTCQCSNALYTNTTRCCVHLWVVKEAQFVLCIKCQELRVAPDSWDDDHTSLLPLEVFHWPRLHIAITMVLQYLLQLLNLWQHTWW